MRRIDFARDASARVLTWEDLAVAVGAIALFCFVAYEAAVAVACLLGGAS